MQEETYVIVEKVFGDFRTYCSEPHHLLEILEVRDTDIKSGIKSLKYEKKIQLAEDNLRITIKADYIEIRFAIKSEDSINTIIESGLAMSQLVHIIYGTGFGDYSTEIYQINQNQAHLVGKVPARGTSSGSGRKPLLCDPFECISLLRRILLVQLKHKSFQRDAIIAALSQILPSGFINIKLAWSWWVFEWTLQHLEQKKPTSQRLRRVMDMFDSHTNYLKNIVSDNLKDIDDPGTLQMLRNIFHDWVEIRKMVDSARNARNKGFHSGRYSGLLSGTSTEKATNLRKFSAFVISLLTFVLTKPPTEFDSEYKADATDWTVVKIPEYTHSEICIPTDDMGLMTWFEWNGIEVVKKQNEIQSYEIDERMDSILKLKPGETFALGGGSGCVIQTMPVMDAFYTIKTDKILAKVIPIFQDFQFIYKIHRLIIEKPD